MSLELTNAEFNSVLCERLREHCDNRIATLRIENDGDRSDIDTWKLRGRIAAFKELKAALTPPAD